MKVRIGFVSNSSSSSFVMIGAKLNDFDRVKVAKRLMELYPETQLDLPSYLKDKNVADLDEDELEDWAYEVLTSSRGGSGFAYFGEEGLFGYAIYCGDSQEYEVGDFSMSLEELQKKTEETKKLLADLGHADVDVKLIGGQYSC